MSQDTAIEKSIKAFVWNKTGEEVYLDLATPSVVNIKHKIKRGSINLAILWANVLQHANNYPVQRYPYRRLYDSNGDKKLLLKVDDVTLTLFLDSGTLMMKGHFVLNWFLDRFEDIMRKFDSEKTSPQPAFDIYHKYDEEWLKLLKEDKVRKDKEIRLEREKEDQALIIEGGDDVFSDTAEQECNKSDATQQNPMIAPKQYERDENSDKVLERLRDGGVEDGPTFIYPLWCACLDRWLSDSATKVYIATPFLDIDRMIDICQIVLKHKLSATLEALFVKRCCDHKLQISDVRRSAQKTFSERDQLFVEYKVYSSIVYPLTNFHAKFTAGVKNGVAEVLVTSASFHADHFVHPNFETVSYLTMSEQEFSHRFLRPLIASQLTSRDLNLKEY